MVDTPTDRFRSFLAECVEGISGTVLREARQWETVLAVAIPGRRTSPALVCLRRGRDEFDIPGHGNTNEGYGWSLRVPHAERERILAEWRKLSPRAGDVPREVAACSAQEGFRITSMDEGKVSRMRSLVEEMVRLANEAASTPGTR